MESERTELSQPEWDRSKVLHEVEEGHLRQVEAAQRLRLRLSDRQLRRIHTYTPIMVSSQELFAFFLLHYTKIVVAYV